jgi:hypothetical protein
MRALMLCCPNSGKQDFQSASLGVGFQKGSLRPAPLASSLGPFIIRSRLPTQALAPRNAKISGRGDELKKRKVPTPRGGSVAAN